MSVDVELELLADLILEAAGPPPAIDDPVFESMFDRLGGARIAKARKKAGT